MAESQASQHDLLLQDRHLQKDRLRSSAKTPFDNEDESGRGSLSMLQLLFAWYLPLAHLLYTILFTAGVVYWLNGRSFTTGDATNVRTRLSQTDVTTIISAFLVMGRTIVGAWQTLAAWRCFFILDEKTKVSRNDVNCIVSWHLPSVAMLKFKRSGNATITTKFTAAVVLMILWPAQLMNPVASGSISWIPAIGYGKLQSTPAIGNAIPGDPWSWYVRYSANRQLLVKRSAGLASLARDTSGGNHTTPWLSTPAQRMVAQFNGYPDGTLVENATVPIFDITSFRWITDITELPAGILSAVTDRDNQYLTISESDSPLLSQAVNGTSALLKDHAWKRPALNRLPEPHAANGTMFAALYVSRDFNDGLGARYKCQTNTSVFGPFPAELINIAWSNSYSDCIAIAQLHVNAGVSHCRQQSTTSLSHSGYLTASSSGVLRAENKTVSPDALVSEVFAMMPEVQSLQAALGLYDQSSMLNNPEPWLRNSLTQAYQGTWSALEENLSDLEHSVTSRARTPYQLLQAQVSTWRMCLWMAVNLLATLSGLLLMQMQSTCRRQTVTDPINTALTMHSSTRALQS